ncbi:MAG: PLP-dependent aminotransferase family protein [Clostridia bacterium]|nr:PLP-dependent aminotransferase family protein [Clostridia bacterium]
MALEQLTFAKRFDGISGSAIREIFKLLAQPGMISFAGGNPAMSALPDGDVSLLAQEALAENGKAILQYGATEGYGPLLESLPAYLSEQLGITVDRSQILPTTGSTQAMDLMCKALIDPGDVILVEDPTFLGNMQCMRLYQAKLVPVPSDENGILLDKLEEAVKTYHPKMLYIIPTFQNPTGRTLALERRKPIADMAAKYGFIVAEDDPYRDLRYTGSPLPAIKSFDTTGHVVFMGSFSKIISPGLRVGCLVADPLILRKCTIGKQSSDVHTANLNQAVVDKYLRKGLLPGHIQEICKSYSDQMNAMLDELKAFPEGTTSTCPEGGLFIWVTLPEGMDALKLLTKCVEKGVAYVPGTHFFADGGHENTLRLNFSMCDVETIRRGMKILKTVIEENM